MSLFDRSTIEGLLFVGLIALLTALILGRTTSWPQRRILWTAATPIPAVATLLAVLLLAEAMTASRESCGVDACGMAAMAGLMLIFLAGIAFILSAGAALFGYWIAKR